MRLSRLSAKCRECPFVEKCEYKEMEALAYLEPAEMPAAMEASRSLLVPHDYRDVKIDANTTITIDLEKLKEQMRQEFYKQVGHGLQFGA